MVNLAMSGEMPSPNHPHTLGGGHMGGGVCEFVPTLPPTPTPIPIRDKVGKMADWGWHKMADTKWLPLFRGPFKENSEQSWHLEPLLPQTRRAETWRERCRGVRGLRHEGSPWVGNIGFEHCTTRIRHKTLDGFGSLILKIFFFLFS